ncbi:hypothetical protein AnigIFM62618_011290 [Aspergillus niger]|nr:hypothetical protein AnigIFM62618_011290 [Aspergillus niger]
MDRHSAPPLKALSLKSALGSTSRHVKTSMNEYSFAPRAQLTCEKCKRRKVKCDKLRPLHQLLQGRDPFVNQFVPTDYHATAFDPTASGGHDTPNVLSPRLLQIYTVQVDPVLPMLQCLALWELVTPGGRYLDYPADHPAPRALGCAIGYMAIITLSSDQCSQEFGTPRGLLLDKYRSLTQLALDRVDYMNADDLTVLEAFVMFLVYLQLPYELKMQTTNTTLPRPTHCPVALDIADPPFTVSAPERQMRQRLWHVISLLDVQASFGRGSAPMLHADRLRSQVFPAMDFLDFFTPSKDDTSSAPKVSLSNPTFVMVMAEAQRAFRSLDLSGGTSPSAVGIDMHLRL